MTEKEKYQDKQTDQFIENKLRKSALKKTSGDFTKMLMERVRTENKAVLEETKRDRIAKYVIGSFSTFIIGFTILIGYMGSKNSVSTNRETGVNLDSTFETSNNFLQQFLSYIQSFFLQVLEFFGVSVNPKTMLIAMVVILVVAVFFIGERIFIRGKLKSGVQLK
jgi:hypothetical protein